ncbi:hypothetical protein ACJX0J_010265, partial [Zea mays]
TNSEIDYAALFVYHLFMLKNERKKTLCFGCHFVFHIQEYIGCHAKIKLYCNFHLLVRHIDGLTCRLSCPHVFVNDRLGNFIESFFKIQLVIHIIDDQINFLVMAIQKFLNLKMGGFGTVSPWNIQSLSPIISSPQKNLFSFLDTQDATVGLHNTIPQRIPFFLNMEFQKTILALDSIKTIIISSSILSKHHKATILCLYLGNIQKIIAKGAQIKLFIISLGNLHILGQGWSAPGVV